MAAEMLADGIKHVVGCYTSSSRKEIIPLFEKADALLWYPSHYEGFESSSNVVYTGAVANQHLLPLVEYLLSYVGPKAFCIGSNYIWAWENNRILREAIGPNGGTVVAERYFPVGCTEFGQAIDAILAARPSFVFNTLIGESSYQFLRDLRAACRSRGIDQAREIPVASCTLVRTRTRGDRTRAQSTATLRRASISPRSTRRRTTGSSKPTRPSFQTALSSSADAEATYLAVRLLALAVTEAGTVEACSVKRAVALRSIMAPQGEVRIDAETMHASLTPRIACSTLDGGFTVLREATRPVPADPYLIRNSSRFGAVAIRPVLRVAS